MGSINGLHYVLPFKVLFTIVFLYMCFYAY